MKKFLLVIILLCSIFSWGQIYQHDFGTTTISAHPYTVAPPVFNSNLNTSSWTNSTSGWTSFGGSTGQAISLSNSSGTPTLTLTFNVATGYEMSVASFNFWRQRSSTGAQNWSMTINGISVGSGTVPATGTAIGTTTVANPVSNLTGTITIVLSLSGASGTGTFRLDDFTLNGTVLSTTPLPEINIQGNSNTILSGDTAPTTIDFTDFGSTNIAGGTVIRTFTIQNIGTLPLLLTGSSPYVTITGVNAADFAVTAVPSSTIAAGGSTTFQVTFDPTTIGVKNAIISIANNDTTGSEDPYTFAIRGTGIATPSIVLSSTNPSVVASTITQATTNNVIYKFDLAVANFDAVLTAITFVTSGSYAASNITNFKAYYSTDPLFSIGTDTFLNNLTTGLGVGSHTFNGFSQTIPISSTGTIFITTDIPCAATVGNTIIVNAINTADFTFTTGTKSGSAFASGTHTIQTATPNNVTGVTTAVCANGQATISWTSPSGCSDNVLVFVTDGVFTTAVPTGNGAAYNAITAFGGGTPFDGGFTVYKGIGNTVSVTGLTNGDSYVFKIFTRNGLVWSNGITVSCTPSIAYCASGATSSLDSEIESVTLTGVNTSILNNTTNACSTGVNNYTAMSADLQVGSSNTLTVEFGDCDGGAQFNGAGGVWIDWNNDGDFDDINESIGTVLVAVSGGNVFQDFTINVPVAQTVGFYRMRIVQKESGTVVNTLPCGTFTYGSTEDYSIEVINTCIPTHAITSFTPASGPIGTEVTINGTGLSGATVAFSGINATVLSTTATQIIAIIPSGATTGTLIVTNTQPCTISNPYTIITKDKTSCEGTSVYNDLILYEIHDEETGSGGTITLYNGTATTKVLTNYRIYRAATAVSGAYSNYATLTGSIAPGALGIIKVSVSDCGPASTNGVINGGFNALDGIQLRASNGTTIIDDVAVASTSAGYYMKRAVGAYDASSSYVASDWTSVSLASGQCAVGLGVAPTTAGGNSPTVTAQPAYTPNCGTVVLTTSATEGFTGGLSLAYQWYVSASGSGSWTAVTNGGVYSGATSATLTISSTAGLNNYQYYCQVRENTVTCFIATNAVRISDDITTWNGTTWTYGAPTLARKAILNADYNTATNGNFQCCTLEVDATRTLTVSSADYVVIDFNIINNGNISVLNNGSIVQVNETNTNSGTYTGTKFQINRTAQAKNLDYIYWSSPIQGFAVSTLPSSHRFEWSPTAANANSTQGNWLTASGTMLTAKGYIARASNGATTAAALPVTFQGGEPNNGIVSVGISRGDTTGTDDCWNLIGNPYPSAISANSLVTENTSIEGSVRLWTHSSIPTTSNGSPFYQNYVYNYSDSDYIVSNGTGSTIPGVFDGNIASGQGFFVRMLEAGETDVNPPINTTTSGSSTITFKNSYRRTAGGAVYDNSSFFKNSTTSTSVDQSRIWLDLISPNSVLTRTLVGYVPGATLAKDRMYDALIEVDSYKLYSLINTQKQTIQGRPVPFDTNDLVPLGMFIQIAGNYTIAIASVDGLFSDISQNIYLEDKLLNLIHDLRLVPYTFTTTIGEFNDRFVLRYTNTTLSNPEFESTNGLVIVSNNRVTLSASENIKSVIVFDLLGRVVYTKNKINTTEVILDKLIPTREALIVKTTFENGQVVTKKILF